MPQKKTWTSEEDKILRYLYEEEKVKKWSTIAQRMAQEFKISGRNGKQCKERYQQLFQDPDAPNVLHTSWTLDEEIQMNRLHDQIGNKWAVIAQKMEGRTDNCVKNHFYSKLRKSIRKLNKVISKKLKKQAKEIRPTVLYKIIEATDEHFKQNPAISQETIELSRLLKTQLLNYSNDGDNQFQDGGDNLEKLKKMAADIQTFNRNYKRKPKKARRGVVQAQNLMSMPKIEKFKCISEDEDDQSNYLVVSEEQSIEIALDEPQIKISSSKNQRQSLNKNNLALKKDFLNNSNSSFKIFNGLHSQQNPGVEALLKNAGVLQDIEASQNQFMKHSLSQSSQFDFKDKKEDKFNLNQSLQRLRYSIILKQDPEIDEQNRLFKSTDDNKLF